MMSFDEAALPHTAVWFDFLKGRDADLAAHCRTLVDLTCREDLCSICGMVEAPVRRILRPTAAQPVTLRLCPNCRDFRRRYRSEEYVEA